MHLTALVLDMDGVLWRGETAMPGLANGQPRHLRETR